MHRTFSPVIRRHIEISFGDGRYSSRALIVSSGNTAHRIQRPSRHHPLKRLRPGIHYIDNINRLLAPTKPVHLTSNEKRRTGYHHEIGLHIHPTRLHGPILCEPPVAPYPFQAYVAPISRNMNKFQFEWGAGTLSPPGFFGVAPILRPKDHPVASGGKRFGHKPITLRSKPFGR